MSPSTSSPRLRSPQDPLSMGKKGKRSVVAAGSTGLASPAPAMPPESAVLGEDGERTRHCAARIRPAVAAPTPPPRPPLVRECGGRERVKGGRCCTRGRGREEWREAEKP